MRTIKYYITGSYQVHTLAIKQQQQIKMFATTVEVNGIEDSTPANSIMQLLREQALVHCKENQKEGNVITKSVQLGNISILDSFTETPVQP